MKKKVWLITVGMLSLLLPSCSRVLTGVSNYYITDYFVLSDPLASFYNSAGENVSSFNPNTDKGNIDVSVSYGSLYAHEGWTAAAHLSLGIKNDLLNFDDRIEDCASNEYLAKARNVGLNRYTYDLKTCVLFGDKISFSDFQKKYEIIILTFEIYTLYENYLWLVTSFRSFGSIVYSGESISEIKFDKIDLNFSRDTFLSELNSSSSI